MLLQIKEARYINEYKVYAKFNDGFEGTVDLKKTMFNDHRDIFKELQDINKFKDFTINFNTITWSNNLDLAPEYIKTKILENIKVN